MIRPAGAGILLLAFLSAAPGALAEDPVETTERRASALDQAFADTAKRVAPSVVAIATPAREELGYGAVLPDGYVLTCRSMLESVSGNEVLLLTRSGAPRRAAIVGRNEAYDVALLKALGGPGDLTPLATGRSRDLAVGQWVVTVGTSPEKPLAVGVVSALDRRVEAHGEAAATPLDLFGLFSENAAPSQPYARVIQHDSPIDGDKHGAPLVDAEGKLVGVNVGHAYRGSSYAAPIDDVMKFLPDLKAGLPGPALPKGGYLGVAVGAIRDRALAQKLGIDGVGVEIREVAKDHAAEKAGLKPGDIVLAVNGEKMESIARFGLVIQSLDPGTSARLRIHREDAPTREVPVILGARE